METLKMLDWLDWICLTTTHILRDILAVQQRCDGQMNKLKGRWTEERMDTAVPMPPTNFGL